MNHEVDLFPFDLQDEDLLTELPLSEVLDTCEPAKLEEIPLQSPTRNQSPNPLQCILAARPHHHDDPPPKTTSMSSKKRKMEKELKKKKKKLLKKTKLSRLQQQILREEEEKENKIYHDFVQFLHQKHGNFLKSYDLFRHNQKSPVITQILMQGYLGTSLDLLELGKYIIAHKKDHHVLVIRCPLTGGSAYISGKGCIKIMKLGNFSDCAFLFKRTCATVQQYHNKYYEGIPVYDRSPKMKKIEIMPDYKVVNITAHVDMGFEIHLSSMKVDIEKEMERDYLSLRHSKKDTIVYESELHNGTFTYRYHVNRICSQDNNSLMPPPQSNNKKNTVNIQIFASGKITFLGATTPQEISEAWIFVATLVNLFRKPNQIQVGR